MRGQKKKKKKKSRQHQGQAAAKSRVKFDVAKLMKHTRMKQELDDFFSFTSDSPDTLVREDVMIVSSSQCLVRPSLSLPLLPTITCTFIDR